MNVSKPVRFHWLWIIPVAALISPAGWLTLTALLGLSFTQSIKLACCHILAFVLIGCLAGWN
jgi:hypothetical protein